MRYGKDTSMIAIYIVIDDELLKIGGSQNNSGYFVVPAKKDNQSVLAFLDVRRRASATISISGELSLEGDGHTEEELREWVRRTVRENSWMIGPQ